VQLVESGLLALDAPVIRYLPWFATRDQALSATITVAQLLHQTSGLPEHDRSETKLLTDNSPAALENGVRATSRIDLLYPPGTRWTYSNANYQILGLLVQTTSGQSFAAYMTRHVFEPAGMRHSYVEKAPAVAAGASAAHYRWFGLSYRATPSIAEPPGLAPAAMMWSSAEDLAQHRILNMNQGTVGGRSVLAPSAVTEMHRPAAEVNVANSCTMGWYMRPA
jgi:CubicO group peptidase (beta-lactamase class C family)